MEAGAEGSLPEDELQDGLRFPGSLREDHRGDVYMYIYIYIYVYTCVYQTHEHNIIYIYIYICIIIIVIIIIVIIRGGLGGSPPDAALPPAPDGDVVRPRRGKEQAPGHHQKTIISNSSRSSMIIISITTTINIYIYIYIYVYTHMYIRRKKAPGHHPALAGGHQGEGYLDYFGYVFVRTRIVRSYTHATFNMLFILLIVHSCPLYI